MEEMALSPPLTTPTSTTNDAAPSTLRAAKAAHTAAAHHQQQYLWGDLGGGGKGEGAQPPVGYNKRPPGRRPKAVLFINQIFLQQFLKLWFHPQHLVTHPQHRYLLV